MKLVVDANIVFSFLIKQNKIKIYSTEDLNNYF